MARDQEKVRACKRRWDEKNRERLRIEHRARYAANIEKERARSRSRPPEQRERSRQRSKERYAARRAEFLEYHKQYREQNREKVRARKRAWMKANRGYARALCAKWNAAKLQACPPWVEWESVQGIYREAVRITRETGIKHDVDHIVPLQSDKVCGLHVPWNLQIMTRSDNARKGNRIDAALPVSRDVHPLRRDAVA